MEEAAAAVALAAGKVSLYRQEPGGWRCCKRTSNVAVSWRPSDEFPGNLYKGEGIVPASPANVWELLKPVANGLRPTWDPNVTGFDVIETISDTVSICRTTTPSALMRLISPRDFVDVVLTKQYEDGTLASTATNIEHALCPPQPSYVRGFNYPCGCFCIPVPGEPDKTQLLSFFQTDLGGYLPQTVVDSFFPSSMIGFYSNLTKAIKTLKA
ncbi:stAR-related lipid transfer protein 5 [Alligator mississippiensis]|uniref:StAR-related lipid transfer protein 5 n=1 Tax=Alligator mississippiensis TaxID=8496 RepID=A0A151M9C4_ALLMI|nr:stAR-related lipid transfer protein 5 [Alligator mississippiensis]KYO21114.1 stAR-related lipid transfer protein 5 [Alligator mississippiensis]